MILRANYCKHQCAAPQTKECPGERGHAGRRGQRLGSPALSLPRAAAGTVWAQCGHWVHGAQPCSRDQPAELPLGLLISLL